MGFITVQYKLVSAHVVCNHLVFHFYSFNKLYWVTAAQGECRVICKDAYSSTAVTVQVVVLGVAEFLNFLFRLLNWDMVKVMVSLNCFMILLMAMFCS